MKKCLIVLVMLVGVLTLSFAQEQSTLRGNLSIWSFIDEVGGQNINNYLTIAFPNVRINYSVIPTDNFQNRLDSVLASGRGAPDVFTLEAAFVRKYVESGLLMDLTDIYEANRNRLLAYPVEIGTYNGRVYAMSWEAHPGAFFYRRSIARRYFGNDDPAFVQNLVSNFDKFLETAERLRAASNGQAVMLASRGDLFNVFIDARSQPWIVNNSLAIDPVMIRYMEISKIFNERGYDAKVGPWSDGWFRAMRDEERDARNRRYEVFGYLFPNWGLQYVLKHNAGNTAGDWAMVQGPAAYNWGGTWVAAWRNTPNAATAKEFIRWLVTNEGFLEEYALASGDIVSSIPVMNRIAPTFSEPFLGGQNHYAAFSAFAQNVNGRTLQSTDQTINSIFLEAENAYVSGEMTLEEALADFRAEVRKQLRIR